MSDVVFHEEPFPVDPPKDVSGQDKIRWAMGVREYVRGLLAKYGCERIEFTGTPADQWKRACAVFDEMSKASQR